MRVIIKRDEDRPISELTIKLRYHKQQIKLINLEIERQRKNTKR